MPYKKKFSYFFLNDSKFPVIIGVKDELNESNIPILFINLVNMGYIRYNTHLPIMTINNDYNIVIYNSYYGLGNEDYDFKSIKYSEDKNNLVPHLITIEDCKFTIKKLTKYTNTYLIKWLDKIAKKYKKDTIIVNMNIIHNGTVIRSKDTNSYIETLEYNFNEKGENIGIMLKFKH
jgi:hypothetical protein